MRLRSIPPANRLHQKNGQPRTGLGLAHISLGRAAHEARKAQSDGAESWAPHVIRKVKGAQQGLITPSMLHAELDAQAQWWKEELDRLREEFSSASLVSIMNELTQRFHWEDNA